MTNIWETIEFHYDAEKDLFLVYGWESYYEDGYVIASIDKRKKEVTYLDQDAKTNAFSQQMIGDFLAGKLSGMPCNVSQ